MNDLPVPRIVPVLTGGGTRLPAHVGVLAALAELGIGYRHIVGVSGGSIVAALLAAGHSVQQLQRLFREVDFRQFRGFSLLSLVSQGGLTSGDHFQAWLDEQIGGVRFADLDMDLHVVATDVLSGEAVIFDRAHTPDEKVAAAVRASMGIPLMFTYRRWQDKVLVDGSILAEDALRQDWAGDGTPSCCFRVRANGLALGRRMHPWFPLPGYLILLVRAFMTSLSREYVSDLYWNTTVLIDSGSIAPTDFALDEAQKMELFRRGYATTLQVLPNKLALLRGADSGLQTA